MKNHNRYTYQDLTTEDLKDILNDYKIEKIYSSESESRTLGTYNVLDIHLENGQTISIYLDEIVLKTKRSE